MTDGLKSSLHRKNLFLLVLVSGIFSIFLVTTACDSGIPNNGTVRNDFNAMIDTCVDELSQTIDTKVLKRGGGSGDRYSIEGYFQVHTADEDYNLLVDLSYEIDSSLKLIIHPKTDAPQNNLMEKLLSEAWQNYISLDH